MSYSPIIVSSTQKKKKKEFYGLINKFVKALVLITFTEIN